MTEAGVKRIQGFLDFLLHDLTGRSEISGASDISQYIQR
jgi:hypothetical protein